MLGVEISPTLTTCVYAFFGTELASCAIIRVLGKKDSGDSDQYDEEEGDSDVDS